MTETCIAWGWYTPETWRELQAIPEAAIEMTYPEFVRKCERQIADLEAQGFRVEKVFIDVGQMVEWCRRNGYEIDSRGRAAFGAALALARSSGQDVMAITIEDRTRSVQ